MFGVKNYEEEGLVFIEIFKNTVPTGKLFFVFFLYFFSYIFELFPNKNGTIILDRSFQSQKSSPAVGWR